MTLKFGEPSYVIQKQDVRNAYRILVWKHLTKWSLEEQKLENRTTLHLKGKRL